MNLVLLQKITLVACALCCLASLSTAQRAALPKGLIQFQDSTLREALLDVKNLDKGILRYRFSGQATFRRAPLDRIVRVEINPRVGGETRRTLIVRPRMADGREQLAFVEQHQGGDYKLLSELAAPGAYYLEEPDGEVIAIPDSETRRRTVLDDLFEERGLTHHNKTVYSDRLKSLRRLTAYLNGGSDDKYPGAYVKGKLEYLRKIWNFTRLSTSLGRPGISIPTEQRVNLEVIQGRPSHILALTALFETPYYETNNLTFIQELGLRKELTYINQVDKFTELDFKLDATFLTAALAAKYNWRSGRHFPFVRLGVGSSLLLAESNRFSRTFRSMSGPSTTNTTDGKFVSTVTVHPGLRAGTEFYLRGPYLLTVGLTYTREMMLFRAVASSSNALGVYGAVSFY